MDSLELKEKKTLYKFFLTASSAISGFKIEEAEPDFSAMQKLQDEKKQLEQNAERKSKTASQEPFQQASKTNGLTDLQNVYENILNCSACPLCQNRKNAVPGEGVTENVDVMVIGEGPGADEDIQGRPFVGKSGQLLDKMLAAINLYREKNCYITNVVKCRPPNNRDPLPGETASCRHFLDSQIEILKPKAILIIGRVALQNVLQTTDGIGKMHGRFFEYSGIVTMATYHPSALLRDVNLKRPAWEDLKVFRRKLNEIKGE